MTARVLLVGIGDFATSFQSGRPRAVLRAIQPSFDVVTHSLPAPGRVARATSRALSILGPAPTLPDRSRSRLLTYHDSVEVAVRRHRPDVVLATSSLSFLEPYAVPATGWPDAPLSMMVDDPSYSRLARLTRSARRRYLAIEARSIENQKFASYPTQRARDFALNFAPDADVRVAPFGPNLDPELLQSVANARSSTQGREKKLSVLFIGLEWIRKGGDIAARAVEMLRHAHYDAELVVIGDCPAEVASQPHIRWLGRVNANSVVGAALLRHELVSSFALAFPSRADNFGAVVAEAAACGLPVVVSQAAGVSEYAELLGFGGAGPHRRGSGSRISQLRARPDDSCRLPQSARPNGRSGAVCGSDHPQLPRERDSPY